MLLPHCLPISTVSYPRVVATSARDAMLCHCTFACCWSTCLRAGFDVLRSWSWRRTSGSCLRVWVPAAALAAKAEMTILEDCFFGCIIFFSLAVTFVTFVFLYCLASVRWCWVCAPGWEDNFVAACVSLVSLQSSVRSNEKKAVWPWTAYSKVRAHESTCACASVLEGCCWRKTSLLRVTKMHAVWFAVAFGFLTAQAWPCMAQPGTHSTHHTAESFGFLAAQAWPWMAHPGTHSTHHTAESFGSLAAQAWPWMAQPGTHSTHHTAESFGSLAAQAWPWMAQPGTHSTHHTAESFGPLAAQAWPWMAQPGTLSRITLLSLLDPWLLRLDLGWRTLELIPRITPLSHER